ncbi:restriction endonuclease subunit S [Vibrio parahaemolyticus]|uniref:methylation-associated defense system restriction endonuclease subunit S MAD5 n=1 Tax=Vibrio parahaemolyticus TaxID=670 RepID=UPI00111D7108|nr:restriction endonuclease subunit S [Vibrio parahaemolyticus]EJV0609175.1 restriction endonuclease subunit S [Vibrio parahaemolyticus]ELB2065609.1 restriction endonuclease subunit S [Vibrio parahaemolyticus]ELB2114389.1 restriction endonuclease subunit S [Vibrio parahaemolyticus]MBM5171045.1 restriction endonuclease subunit S [Vibrio parahaemolyticus]MBM5188972.1 restriction endonuclease subunit S [Vibrio parahaemolyticus]
MRIKTIPSNWLSDEGRRLDCGPYMTGAKEAEKIIDDCLLPKKELKDFLVNGAKGAFHAGREGRVWVKEERYGVPFMGSVDIIQANLDRLPLISKEQVSRKPLFRVFKDWVLITRSGTIGRMTLARQEMDGHACSEHVMRVVPDPEKIFPGYLYCYLRSKFGVPLVVSSTYGAIIQHIEPHHVINLPVPIVDKQIEEKAHELINKCGDNRTESNALLKKAGQLINKHFSFPNKLALSHRIFTHSAASSSLVQKRMDATYHDQIAQMSDDLVEQAGAEKTLAELGVNTGESGRMKLIFTESDHGVPFSTSGEIFRARYEPKRFLAKSKLGDVADWGVRQEDILLARSGQVGGIIGTGVWADSRFENAAVSVDVIRIKAQESEVLPGYLYAYLMCTDVGYRQLIRSAAGSSIPHLSSDDVLKLKLPRMGTAEEKAVHELVQKAGELAAEAQKLEDEAVKMVEDAIEAAAPKH